MKRRICKSYHRCGRRSSNNFEFIFQSFAPLDVKETSLSVKWLYDHVAELWSDMLSPDALETVKSGGYYTTSVRPGLRIIALNNNVCFTFNWWILFEVKSIRKQFQWLHDTLLIAEKTDERVHILSHIPNGDEDYHQPCSREYRRIVDRFHKTIVAQFNGHTEFFGFNLFNKSVAFNGGSLATFSGVNRNYNAYNVNPQSFVRLDTLEIFLINFYLSPPHLSGGDRHRDVDL